MVRLFVSDRVLIDGSFCNGGIAVRNDGKIDKVFKDRSQLDQWLDANKHIEVNSTQLVHFFVSD